MLYRGSSHTIKLMELPNPDITTTMRAAQFDTYSKEGTVVVRDIPVPNPSDDQVLVKVSATSLNPFDLAVMRGDARAMCEVTFPATIGQDFAGTIVKIGNSVNNFSLGDKVYGTANALFGGSGACAEFVAANAKNIAVAPLSIDGRVAASLPTAGATALQALKNLHIKSGDKLFIEGGAGGVGSFAIQIAKSMGAYVVSSSSSKNSDFVRKLGADEVLDYTQLNYLANVRDFDAGLHAVPSNPNNMLGSLRRGARAVSLTQPFDVDIAKNLEISVLSQSTKITTDLLTELTELVNKGPVKPYIEQAYSLDAICEAYMALKNSSISGKIIINIP